MKLILSPHPDDAVLSLWSVLTGPGDVAVLNLFAGAPSARRDMGWWDRRTGARDPLSRARERLAEDARALGLAGRSAASLGFLDFQYRGADQPLEPLVAAVTERVPDDAVVLAPAALGDHPDHRQARDVGVELARHGVDVRLYADLPHAAGRPWPSDARVFELDDADAARKLEAVSRYRTQLAALEARFSILSDPSVLRREGSWAPASTTVGARGHR